jgi:hypothetical protein
MGSMREAVQHGGNDTHLPSDEGTTETAGGGGMPDLGSPRGRRDDGTRQGEHVQMEGKSTVVSDRTQRAGSPERCFQHVFDVHIKLGSTLGDLDPKYL